MALNKATDLEGRKGFDLDLAFGKHFEHLMDDIFSGVYKAEIKTERDQWAKTGNIAIELEYRKKNSGLTRTTADVWVHNLSVKGDLLCSIIIPVDTLRKIIKKMEEDGVGKTIMGGDKYASKLYLAPITELMKYIQKEGQDAWGR